MYLRQYRLKYDHHKATSNCTVWIEVHNYVLKIRVICAKLYQNKGFIKDMFGLLLDIAFLVKLLKRAKEL
jgi:hypothetical protein